MTSMGPPIVRSAAGREGRTGQTLSRLERERCFSVTSWRRAWRRRPGLGRSGRALGGSRALGRSGGLGVGRGRGRGRCGGGGGRPRRRASLRPSPSAGRWSRPSDRPWSRPACSLRAISGPRHAPNRGSRGRRGRSSSDSGNVVGRGHHFDRVQHEVERAALLQARRSLAVLDVHRDADAHARARRSARKKSTCIGRSVTTSSW